MSLFSGARLTDRDIEVRIHTAVQRIVRRLNNGEIDPPDAIHQLTDLVLRAARALTRPRDQVANGE